MTAVSDKVRTERGAALDALADLPSLWAHTRGDPRVCVAVLDGPVDQAHPSLAGADLTLLETLVAGAPDRGPAGRHGTHVASVIFAQPGSPLVGLASPRAFECRPCGAQKRRPGSP